MHHYFEAITNRSGDSQIGKFARVIDPVTLGTVTLSADNNGTPIITVSGVADMAVTDENGNISLYVEPGTYHFDLYESDATTFIMRVPNVAMNSSKGDAGPQGPPGAPGAKGDPGDVTSSQLTAAINSRASKTITRLETGAVVLDRDNRDRQIVYVEDWGALDDNASDATALIQKALDEAPIGCDLMFPTPPTPDYYYRITSQLVMHRKMNLIGNGVQLLGVFPSSANDPANDLLKINVEDVYNRDARNIRISGFRNIGFLSGGRHVIRVANDGLNIAHIGLIIEQCKISGHADDGCYAIRLDGLGTHTNNTIRDNQIENGIMISCADGTNVYRNNMYGIRPSITLDLIEGAYRTSIWGNIITSRDGALLVLNGDEWLFYDNQCEQFPGYGPNQSEYGAQVTLIGQVGKPIVDGHIIGNNFGAGTNCQAAVVIAQNAQDILLDKNQFRIGRGDSVNRDIRILAASVIGTVIGPLNTWRGFRPGTPDANNPYLIDDAGVATKGIWKPITAGDMSAGWAPVASGFSYKIASDGRLAFKGGVTAGYSASGAPGAVTWAMPLGARPYNDMVISTDNNSSANEAKMIFYANGEVKGFFTAAGNELYFNNSYDAKVKQAYYGGII